MSEAENTVELDEKEVGALLYLLGMEIARLRSASDNEGSYEIVGENEINFYKQLAFKLNKTA